MYVKYINDNEFITYFFCCKRKYSFKALLHLYDKNKSFFLMFQNYKLSSFPAFSNSLMHFVCLFFFLYKHSIDTLQVPRQFHDT